MYLKNKSLAKPIPLNSLCPENFIVIDLRSRGYFLISHIKGALNIESFQRVLYIAQENPQKKILLYCHSGATAADFGTQLVKQGLENIYYIDANYFAIKKYNIPQEGEGL